MRGAGLSGLTGRRAHVSGNVAARGEKQQWEKTN